MLSPSMATEESAAAGFLDDSALAQGEGDDDVDDDDDDNARYRLTVNGPRPKKISQRRREDEAIWESFCATNSEAIVKENSDRIEQQREQQKQLAATRQPQSVFRDLIEAGERNARIIDSAREYQIALFERCKTRNTIVVLDTGGWETGHGGMWSRADKTGQAPERRSLRRSC
jgi:endoribonuclease Dicer